MSSSRKKRRTRSRSTNTPRVHRVKTTKSDPEAGQREQSHPDIPGGAEAPSPIPESVPQSDPVPQPAIETPFMLGDVPNIVTGYVRLITLGLSFFLAVYLGLEAFSIFV